LLTIVVWHVSGRVNVEMPFVKFKKLTSCQPIFITQSLALGLINALLGSLLILQYAHQHIETSIWYGKMHNFSNNTAKCLNWILHFYLDMLKFHSTDLDHTHQFPQLPFSKSFLPQLFTIACILSNFGVSYVAYYHVTCIKCCTFIMLHVSYQNCCPVIAIKWLSIVFCWVFWLQERWNPTRLEECTKVRCNVIPMANHLSRPISTPELLVGELVQVENGYKLFWK
jgi:hypothetical protein